MALFWPSTARMYPIEKGPKMGLLSSSIFPLGSAILKVGKGGGDWTRVYFRTTIKCPAPWHWGHIVEKLPTAPHGEKKPTRLIASLVGERKLHTHAHSQETGIFRMTPCGQKEWVSRRFYFLKKNSKASRLTSVSLKKREKFEKRSNFGACPPNWTPTIFPPSWKRFFYIFAINPPSLYWRITAIFSIFFLVRPYMWEKMWRLSVRFINHRRGASSRSWYAFVVVIPRADR